LGVNLKTAILKEIIPNYWHFSLEYTKIHHPHSQKFFQKPQPKPTALAFQNLKLGQSHGQAMTLAQPGLAWPMA